MTAVKSRIYKKPHKSKDKIFCAIIELGLTNMAHDFATIRAFSLILSLCQL